MVNAKVEGQETSMSKARKRGGWYPYTHWKGKELERELWVYSTHMSYWDQEDGFWETMQQREVSISWLFLSF